MISLTLGFTGNWRDKPTLLPLQSDSLTLLKTIEVGGMPDSIVVDHTATRNDVAFYDMSNGKLRFLDGDTLTMTTDEISLPTWAFDSWMQYDRHFNRIYVLTVATKTGWEEANVKVIDNRSLLITLSINNVWNTSETPDEVLPWNSPTPKVAIQRVLS
jgi:hypothetical protein